MPGCAHRDACGGSWKGSCDYIPSNTVHRSQEENTQQQRDCPYREESCAIAQLIPNRNEETHCTCHRRWVSRPAGTKELSTNSARTSGLRLRRTQKPTELSVTSEVRRASPREEGLPGTSVAQGGLGGEWSQVPRLSVCPLAACLREVFTQQH